MRGKRVKELRTMASEVEEGFSTCHERKSINPSKICKTSVALLIVVIAFGAIHPLKYILRISHPKASFANPMA